MISNIKRNNSWKCSKFDENYKPVDSRSSMNPKHKIHQPNCSIISDKEWGRKVTLYTEEKTWRWPISCQKYARGERSFIYKVLREFFLCWSRILHMLFKKEGRIKIVFRHTKAEKLHQQQICTMKNIKASLSDRKGKIVGKKEENE